MTAPARGRGRPRDPETDAAILRAALEVFVERGIEGLSIEQVAKRAGVGKLTVYRRWATKEELVSQAIQTMVSDELTLSLADLDALSPYEITERALPAAAELAASPGYRALIARIWGSAVSHPSLMAVTWERYILPRRRLAAYLIERARQEGLLAADADADVLIDMMVGAVMYRALQPDPPDTDEMLRYLRAVYRQAGLLPPEPS
ncbi:TetR/AcrR family transcriptional regulator [Nonomuraea terrae]|uniref:TetR/AcrR family transcriptional regulator n=1 Tax=Nonomuraea terrae TaxID=2530383 RepID=A0A4R4YD29_9ACTN|nr:TetR/AcrR family transcriptional regulator [Nonomuraea terrae]TDD42608.1 TetR/AcrR family transcriptional regulator [Nonomuraea terrae]